ncbi:archaetidylserine decarboxylase [Rhodoferax sp. OV413]|uniref:archaetidylserine decarboxylase n=1 Tax=Rhodoferax sp. OV413 TaxID=1855285 RepID=UPI0025E972AA|nr:archaetidylserine decarboxylase [Rhodoferax sp. OV413]
MSLRAQIQNILNQEDLNFLLTNRIPRQALTRFMGWFSKIEQPFVKNASIGIWKFFSELDLSEAKKTEFTSMHDCFTRELKDGARPITQDAMVMTSPVDAIVGASGAIEGTKVFQAKGFPYTLEDLLGKDADIEEWRDGSFVTLRLTSSMYHRFHAPYDCTVDEVRYFSGDTWNVNPIALKRVEKLFCKNERAYIGTRLNGAGPLQGKRVALVPVAAVLVASIRLHWLDVLFHVKYKGPERIACSATFSRGQEMGWFQHGSTVIVLAPKGFALSEGLELGTRVRMGQALLRWHA